MSIEKLRLEYHKNIFNNALTTDENSIPNNADKHSKISVELAKSIVSKIALKTRSVKTAGQTYGKSFETITAAYLESAFKFLKHIRPGKYEFFIGKSIDEFEQYEHLALITKALKDSRELRATLGDYIISPDIIIGKKPFKDYEINKKRKFITDVSIAQYTPLRQVNSKLPILHASISCKWTIRSDRSQNARTEGLNLIRSRKGHTPHIAIITAEPYPQRISSLALGTGDIDCVYHFALKELNDAVEELGNDSVSDMLDTLVQGKRLRDISDLPFDLVI